MDNLQILLSVALIWSIAVISPGPNFFITLQASSNKNLLSKYLIVLGIALGTVIWSFLGFFGITYIITTSPILFSILKILGGSYLIYLGIKLLFLKIKNTKNINTTNDTPFKYLKLGLFTNLSNPKTALFMTSLFATTLHENTTFDIGILSIILIFFISILWYGFITFLFSTNYFKTIFQKYQNIINKLSSVIFIIFGINVITEKPLS